MTTIFSGFFCWWTGFVQVANLKLLCQFFKSKQNTEIHKESDIKVWHQSALYSFNYKKTSFATLYGMRTYCTEHAAALCWNMPLLDGFGRKVASLLFLSFWLSGGNPHFIETFQNWVNWGLLWCWNWKWHFRLEFSRY